MSTDTKKVISFFYLCIVMFVVSVFIDRMIEKAIRGLGLEDKGHQYRVTLYAADGKPLSSWVATGPVESTNRYGFWFIDQKTGKDIQISGNVVVEPY
jgi:hypothetical protein